MRLIDAKFNEKTARVRIQNSLNIIKQEQLTIDSCNAMLEVMKLPKEKEPNSWSGTITFENGKIINVEEKIIK